MSTDNTDDDGRRAGTGKQESFPSSDSVTEVPALAAALREQRRKRLSNAFGRYIWEGDLAKMREGSPREWG